MKNLLRPFASVLMCALIVSCQKENSDANATGDTLTGTYNFISMQTNGVSTTSASDGPYTMQTVTVTKYVTRNNAGTVTFTPTTMTSSNLSYDIDTVVEVSSYKNGVLEEKMGIPFYFSVPPTSATSNYKVITSDSLYFSSGSMFRDGSATQATEASGAKIRKQGDKLFMTIHTSKTSTQMTQGIPVTIAINGVATITLQKK